MCCFRKMLCRSSVYLFAFVCLFGDVFGGNTPKGGNVLGEETDSSLASKDSDSFVSKSHKDSIGSALEIRFNEFCRKWFEVFGVGETVEGVKQGDWQSYMVFLFELAELGPCGEVTPTFEGFVNAISQVLTKFTPKILDKEIKGRLNQFDEYEVSRRGCLFFLLKGAALRFRREAEENLDLYAVWTAWQRCKSLFFMLEGSTNLGEGDIEGLQSTEATLRKLLEDKRVLKRSSVKCIEEVSTLVEDIKLTTFYREFLKDAQRLTEQLLGEANASIRKTFHPSVQDYVKDESISPFECLSSSGVAPFQCFLGADLVGSEPDLTLELCYWLSLEELTRKNWDFARFVRVLNPESESQCYLARNGRNFPISLMEGPSLSREERKGVVDSLRKNAGACPDFNPRTLLLDGCNGDLAPLHPQPFNCDLVVPQRSKGSLICYNAGSGALTASGNSKLYFALLYKGFYRKVEGQLVFDFVSYNESDEVCFSFPGKVLSNGKPVIFRVFVTKTDLLLAKSYWKFSKRLSESESGIYYNVENRCFEKRSFESLTRKLRLEVENRLNAVGLAIHNDSTGNMSGCSESMRNIMRQDVLENEREILELVKKEVLEVLEQRIKREELMAYCSGKYWALVRQLQASSVELTVENVRELVRMVEEAEKRRLAEEARNENERLVKERAEIEFQTWEEARKERQTVYARRRSDYEASRARWILAEKARGEELQHLQEAAKAREAKMANLSTTSLSALEQSANERAQKLSQLSVSADLGVLKEKVQGCREQLDKLNTTCDLSPLAKAVETRKQLLNGSKVAMDVVVGKNRENVKALAEVAEKRTKASEAISKLRTHEVDPAVVQVVAEAKAKAEASLKESEASVENARAEKARVQGVAEANKQQREQLKKEIEELNRQQAEEERVAQEKAEAERKAKEAAEEAEAKRLAEEKAEQERFAKDAELKRLEEERLVEEARKAEELRRQQEEAAAKALAEQKAKEEAEAKRLAEEKAEQERLEAERKAKEAAEKAEAERRAAEEQKRLEEARKAEALKRQQEEAEKQRLAEEARVKAEQERLEAERKAKEEAERLEQERKAKEEAERKAAEEAEKQLESTSPVITAEDVIAAARKLHPNTPSKWKNVARELSGRTGSVSRSSLKRGESLEAFNKALSEKNKK